MTSKSRLTSSSANGMYWLASLSTCTSSSSSDRPPGKMIFLVITAAGGMPSATSFAADAAFFPYPAHGFRHLLDVFDIAVHHGTARQRLRRKAFETQFVLAGFRQLDQLDAGRTDIQSNQGRIFFADQRSKI